MNFHFKIKLAGFLTPECRIKIENHIELAYLRKEIALPHQIHKVVTLPKSIREDAFLSKVFVDADETNQQVYVTTTNNSIYQIGKIVKADRTFVFESATPKYIGDITAFRLNVSDQTISIQYASDDE